MTGDNYFVTRFEVTPIMATYLIAIVIADYSILAEDITPYTHTKVRIGGRPNYGVRSGNSHGQFALQAVARLIDGFSQKLHFNYSSVFNTPKSDHFALPQFGPGAMESWGLVLYREKYLFYEDGIDDESQKMTVLTTIAHEVMHQWFGNLVGCDFWDELWISEAFATFGGYMGLEFIEPSWKWEDEFWYRFTRDGLRFDSTKYSHPVVNKANNGGVNLRDFRTTTANDLAKQFDRISYHKAGSLLRMIRNLVGEEPWLNGLREYLTDNQFSAVDGDVLMNTLSKFVPNSVLPLNMNFTEIFDPWIRQTGYPILHVTREVPGVISINVSRYKSDNFPANWPETSYNYEWHIPFTYKHKYDDTIELHWLINGGNEKAFNISDNGNFLVGNINSNGFYRIEYDDNLLSEIIQSVKLCSSKLTTIEKATLFNDYAELENIKNVIKETERCNLTILLVSKVCSLFYFVFH